MADDASIEAIEEAGGQVERTDDGLGYAVFFVGDEALEHVAKLKGVESLDWRTPTA